MYLHSSLFPQYDCLKFSKPEKEKFRNPLFWRLLSFEIRHNPERVRNQILIKKEQWNFSNVKKLNLFCNFWSSKYCLRNCNATIYACCEKMFELNGFIWFFPRISTLWLSSLKYLQGLMVFEKLIYKEVFSKPTSYI